MLQVRLDVTGVPPQGGYVAKQCPVRAQWDTVRPGEPLPPSAGLRRRLDRGNAFEAEVFASLAALHPDAVVIDRGGPDDRADREARTLAALRAGAPMVIGGRLPGDEVGRRVGEPDLLVAADGGYHPVDVKHHATVAYETGEGSRYRARSSPLEAPFWATAVGNPEHEAAKSKGDLLQLAHYRRMLEALGLAATTNHGGIIGTDLVATFHDLDAPIWTTPSASEGRRVRSTMEVYDFEFGFRLDVIATARAHLDDPSVPLKVVPVRIGECSSCPWWGHCHDLLVEADDISLLPRIGWNRWKRHTERGVTTLAELASLDHRSATLCDRGVDLALLFDALDALDRSGGADDKPVAELIGRRRHGQIAKLAEAGVYTAADARRLDRRVAPYTGVRIGELAEAIDAARARRAPDVALRRRGAAEIVVPRGDVEVDLDLESTEDGVYLWGVLVTDRSGASLVETGYRPFVTWEPLGPAVEGAVLEELLDHLGDIGERVTTGGLTWRVYCFNERAEATELRRIAAAGHVATHRADQVEDLLASDVWVDLLAVAQRHLVTGTSMGLKHLAPLAGFSWEDDDPGGEQSMGWHELAVGATDPVEREANRHRILTYNRNDVEATLALREWLEHEAPALGCLEDTDAAYGW